MILSAGWPYYTVSRVSAPGDCMMLTEGVRWGHRGPLTCAVWQRSQVSGLCCRANTSNTSNLPSNTAPLVELSPVQTNLAQVVMIAALPLVHSIPSVLRYQLLDGSLWREELLLRLLEELLLVGYLLGGPH